MQYDRQPQKHITICLNDSIFKDSHQQTTYQQHNYSQPTSTHLSHTHIKPLPVNKYPKTSSLDYINAQFYGKVNNKKQPFGQGILIDDQFNFFLSNWKDELKMNGLTFIKLLNQSMMYGTWVQGKMNGWNIVKIGATEIFMEMKNEGRIDSPVLVVNNDRQVAYLLQVSLQRNFENQQKPKIQIINRKQLNPNKQKQKSKNLINLREIFASTTDIKIPHFLFSFNDFITHLNENVQDVEVRKVELDSQKHMFLSIKEDNQMKEKEGEEEERQKSYFIPFPQLLPSKETLTQRNSKKLGMLYSCKTNKTSSLGQLNNQACLSGLGISFPTKSSETLLGLFKSNMLIHQFDHPYPFDKNALNSRSLKKQLTQHHMKSVNFVNDFVYFSEVDETLVMMKRIIEFVEIFQLEYGKYAGQRDSFAQSDQEYEEIKYEQQTREKVKFSKIEIKNKDQEYERNVFVKRTISKESLQFPSLALRPYGKIVKSRSPLRKLQSHSNSKSPSDIQTFRKPYNPSNIIAQKSPYKNLKISTFSSMYNSKYNQQTLRNKNENESNKYKKQREPKFFYAHNRQKQRQEDVIETIRLRDEYRPIDMSSRKSVIREKDYEEYKPYSKHLRNNYFQRHN